MTQGAEYVARLERLLDTALELCADLPSGWEPAGQDMSTTMRQHRVREFRKAVNHAAAARNDGQVSP